MLWEDCFNNIDGIDKGFCQGMVILYYINPCFPDFESHLKTTLINLFETGNPGDIYFDSYV